MLQGDRGSPGPPGPSGPPGIGFYGPKVSLLFFSHCSLVLMFFTCSTWFGYSGFCRSGWSTRSNWSTRRGHPGTKGRQENTRTVTSPSTNIKYQHGPGGGLQTQNLTSGPQLEVSADPFSAEMVDNFLSSPFRGSPGFWVQWVLVGHQETLCQERRYRHWLYGVCLLISTVKVFQRWNCDTHTG